MNTKENSFKHALLQGSLPVQTGEDLSEDSRSTPVYTGEDRDLPIESSTPSTGEDDSLSTLTTQVETLVDDSKIVLDTEISSSGAFMTQKPGFLDVLIENSPSKGASDSSNKEAEEANLLEGGVRVIESDVTAAANAEAVSNQDLNEVENMAPLPSREAFYTEEDSVGPVADVVENRPVSGGSSRASVNSPSKAPGDTFSGIPDSAQTGIEFETISDMIRKSGSLLTTARSDAEVEEELDSLLREQLITIEYMLRSGGYPTGDMDERLWSLSEEVLREALYHGGNPRDIVSRLIWNELDNGVLQFFGDETLGELEYQAEDFTGINQVVLENSLEDLELMFPTAVTAVKEYPTVKVLGSHRRRIEDEAIEIPGFTPKLLGEKVEESLTFVPSLGRDDDFETFFYVEIKKGTAKSRRFQAGHYGLAVAGYVSKSRVDSAIELDLNPIKVADPLNGLTHEYRKVIPNPSGLWPFGLVGSSQVVWARCDVLQTLTKGSFCSLVKARVEEGGHGIACIDNSNKIENTYIGLVGDALEGIEGLVQSPLLLRRAIILYNSVYEGAPLAYEGAFPCIQEDLRSCSEFRSWYPCLSNFDRALTGAALSNTGMAFAEGRLYVSPLTAEVRAVDVRIRRSLSAVEEFDFEIVENQGIPVEIVGEYPSEYVSRTETFLFGDFEVSIPGTTAVDSREFVSTFGVESNVDSIPINSTGVHPIAAYAQHKYNREVASSGGSHKWNKIEAPLRRVSRRQFRSPCTRVHHVGDRHKGSAVEHHSLVDVVPTFMMASVEHNASMCRARDALVRAVYHFGSSVADEIFMMEVKWNIRPGNVNQSYLGLTIDGKVDREVYPKDDIPILLESEKDLLSSLLEAGDEEKIRSVSLNWNKSLSRIGSCVQTGRALDEGNDPSLNRISKEEDILDGLVVDIVPREKEEEFAELFSGFCRPGVLSSVGNRLNATTVPLKDSKPFPKAETSFVPSSVIDEDTFVSVLGSDRLLSGTTVSRKKPSELLSSAKKGSRSALLTYIRKKEGQMVAMSSDTWRVCSFTWEAVDFEVIKGYHVGPETTWRDFIFACQSTEYERVRRSDSYFLGAAAEARKDPERRTGVQTLKSKKSKIVPSVDTPGRIPSYQRGGRYPSRSQNEIAPPSGRGRGGGRPGARASGRPPLGSTPEREPPNDAVSVTASVNSELSFSKARDVASSAASARTADTLHDIAAAIYFLHTSEKSDRLHNLLTDLDCEESKRLSKSSTSLGALVSSLKKGQTIGPYGRNTQVGFIPELDF